MNIALTPGGELPAPDPADPNRKTWTLPEVFSPADAALYYSNQFVFRTRDHGKSWQKISPDLSGCIRRFRPTWTRSRRPISTR